MSIIYCFLGVSVIFGVITPIIGITTGLCVPPLGAALGMNLAVINVLLVISLVVSAVEKEPYQVIFTAAE